MFPVGTGMNRCHLLLSDPHYDVPRRHGDEPACDLGTYIHL